MLVRGLLEENCSALWTAEPGGPAHLNAGASHQSVRLTEVENQLHAAIRKGAFAAMRARTVVRPQVIDQPLQFTWPPDAVGPTTERRDTAYRLERERSEATRRIHAGVTITRTTPVGQAYAIFKSRTCPRIRASGRSAR